MDFEGGDCSYSDSEDYDDNDEVKQLVESQSESDDEVLVTGKEVTNCSAGHQKNYRILKAEEIKKLQENDISYVINVLSVSRSVACTLLCQHRWNRSSVLESWFDENRYAETKFAVTSSPEKEDCRLCCRTEEALSGVCRHLFCVRCWRNHIIRWKNEDPGCQQALTCPEPGCKTDPGYDMVNLVSLSYDKDNYYHFLCRSYVDSSTNRKWCPNVTCDLAIQFEKSGEDESENYNVKCDCGYMSCWRCGQEGHSPLDCATAAKWVRGRKKKTEADSAAWILANTMPCPKCDGPIQNEGSIQVICGDPCGYEFCWRCRRPWEGHDFCSQCMWAPRHNEEEQRVRKKARIDDPLERYVHHNERFDSYDKSQKRASAELTSVKSNEPRLRFEVWEQIVECRRVLKWSYAYGYYLSESGAGRLSLFEHLLEEAESSLERLQHCAEKEMVWHTSADSDCYSDGFKEFGLKLKDLIWVTKSFFENLAKVSRRDFSYDD